MTTPVPQPPPLPLVGNLFDWLADREVLVRCFGTIAKRYGEIYKLNILGRWITIVSSHALQNELSDDTRFRKKPKLFPAFRQINTLLPEHPGLFTAELDDPEWGIAHRLLTPAFSAPAIKGMFTDMVDIASQLLLKWERLGPEEDINPVPDFTRLTYDTVALCSMSYRFNSFYMDTDPPFIKAMSGFLRECELRARRPAIIQWFMWRSNAKFEADKKLMRDLALEIVAKRRANPSGKKDLLSFMLENCDPRTGKAMTDGSIVMNLVTFLVAGHETTAGLLSFTFYYLLKNPQYMERLRAEIDEVIGDQPLRVEHLSQLPFTTAVLRESLRLQPSLPARGVVPNEATTLLGGKYAVKKDELLLILQTATQSDPEIWGDDAHEFKPDRMMNGKFEKLPKNAWQPFGYGHRKCIGRAFAWQESLINIILIVQRFDLTLADPNYELQLHSTLTLKPKSFQIRASLRQGRQNLCFTPLAAV